MGRLSRKEYVAFCAALLALAMGLSGKPALAVNKVWTGRVLHVSTDNIKVVNPKGHVTLSFLIVPRFKQIFSSDGKTTYQMADIKPGMWVTIYYDQNALGARHADKIILLKNGKVIKS